MNVVQHRGKLIIGLILTLLGGIGLLLLPELRDRSRQPVDVEAEQAKKAEQDARVLANYQRREEANSAGQSADAGPDAGFDAGSAVDVATRAVAQVPPVPVREPEEPARPGHEALHAPAPHADDKSAGGPPLPREVIVAAIEELKPVAKECYETLLDDFPDAAGTVRISFVFETENGMSRVQMSEITDQTTLFDSELHDCLSQAVGTLELPRTPHDTRMTVTYPFHFRADNGP